MAAIGTVTLQIATVDGDPEIANVVVDYTVAYSHDDIVAGTTYHEVLQLYIEGPHVIGPVRHEVPVSGGLLLDELVTFDANHQSFVHSVQASLPLSALTAGGLGPFDRDAVQARVTLTPLPPSAVVRRSNTVVVEQPPVVEA